LQAQPFATLSPLPKKRQGKLPVKETLSVASQHAVSTKPLTRRTLR
jgi:hypothetical protein